MTDATGPISQKVFAKLIDNDDVLISDTKLSDILASLVASGVDLAALEVLTTAINTALQAGGVTQAQLAALVTAVTTQGSGVYTTPTHTAPSIAAATTEALAANADRLYALLVNDSVETIYIKLGAAAVLNQGIRLNANGGSYEMSREFGNLYVGAINGIGTSGAAVLLVTEGV